MQIALFIVLIIGIILVVVSLIAIQSDKPKPNAVQHLEVDNTIRAIDVSVKEADEALEELQHMAKSIFVELEGKYQELLFLYNMINEKRKDIAPSYDSYAGGGETIRQETAAHKQAMVYVHPRKEEIVSLKGKGFTVPEIAKTLDMGQGEVKLILELGKANQA